MTNEQATLVHIEPVVVVIIFIVIVNLNVVESRTLKLCVRVAVATNTRLLSSLMTKKEVPIVIKQRKQGASMKRPPDKLAHRALSSIHPWGSSQAVVRFNLHLDYIRLNDTAVRQLDYDTQPLTCCARLRDLIRPHPLILVCASASPQQPQARLVLVLHFDWARQANEKQSSLKAAMFV